VAIQRLRVRQQSPKFIILEGRIDNSSGIYDTAGEFDALVVEIIVYAQPPLFFSLVESY
jgi:hypothetical protein